MKEICTTGREISFAAGRRHIASLGVDDVGDGQGWSKMRSGIFSRKSCEEFMAFCDDAEWGKAGQVVSRETSCDSYKWKF